jgi:phospholipid-binding lipoprotein MlaA
MDLTYYIWGKDKDNYDYIGAIAIRTINNLSLDKDTYEGIKKDALDPYLFVRDAYAQYRQNKIEK